jgi:hypothetical protein
MGERKMSKQSKYLIGQTVLEVKDAISVLLAQSQPAEDPLLIEEGYETFNILQCGRDYYGLSQDEGAFEPQMAKKRKYKKCFRANSIAEVKKAINSLLRPQNDTANMGSSVPRLVEDSYHGFNIIHFRDKYYGLSQDQGEFDITRFQKNLYDHCYQTTTADEIRNIIDKVAARSNQSREPILIEEDYRGYNIVLFGDKYYGVFRNGEAFDANKV